MKVDEAIQSRHSVKKFSDKKPDWRTIIECIDSARYAPMAGNCFSLQFILVDNQETINKVADAAAQDFIKQAQYLVVFCSNPTQTTRYYGNRGYDYLRQQAGAAIQNFLLKITENGLSTCWVGHFENTAMRKALGISEKIAVEAVFPIGYEHKIKAKPKKKCNLDNVLFFNKYKNKKMNSVREGLA